MHFVERAGRGIPGYTAFGEPASEVRLPVIQAATRASREGGARVVQGKADQENKRPPSRDAHPRIMTNTNWTLTLCLISFRCFDARPGATTLFPIRSILLPADIYHQLRRVASHKLYTRHSAVSYTLNCAPASVAAPISVPSSTQHGPSSRLHLRTCTTPSDAIGRDQITSRLGLVRDMAKG